jgi:hypothetical protein
MFINGPLSIISNPDIKSAFALKKVLKKLYVYFGKAFINIIPVTTGFPSGMTKWKYFYYKK